MLYEALRFGVQVRSVDDLTDEEYNVALKKTHEDYVKHPTYPHRDRISFGCGPADATERSRRRRITSELLRAFVSTIIVSS